MQRNVTVKIKLCLKKIALYVGVTNLLLEQPHVNGSVSCCITSINFSWKYIVSLWAGLKLPKFQHTLEA